MEEYKYAVVSGGLYCKSVAYRTWAKPERIYQRYDTALVVTGRLCSIWYASGDAEWEHWEVTAINYTPLNYSNVEKQLTLVNEDNYDNSIAMKYSVTVTHTQTNSNNIIADNYYYHGYSDKYTYYSKNEVVLSNHTKFTSNYNLIFYYPNSGKTYEYSNTYDSMYVEKADYSSSGETPTVYAKITSCSIQNLYRTVLTDRILNTLYA